jgi:3-dehydroquinate dehydratase/shikimate dehydrogenase
MICVSIGRTRHGKLIQEHQSLAQRGARLVEYRLDWLGKKPEVTRLVKDRPTPVVVACRRREDRGRWPGTEEERIKVLREAIVAGVEYVDLELDIAKSIPRYGKTKRIISYHNFDDTPEDLGAIHAKLAACDPDVVKLVTTANWPGDNARVLDVVRRAKVPTVGFCMGELGTVSRVLCGKFGAPFTYATFSSERVLAPGQLSFDEMKRLYRYDEIKSDTEVFAVAGDPVAHSYSPLIHNAAFRAAGLNAVYAPIRVPKHHFPQAVKGLEPLGVRGYSVTIPHKEAALEVAAERDPMAVEIGAANTLYKSGDGRWAATNTDYEAAMSCLLEGLRKKDPDATLEGKKVLMLGAGGVARAIGLGCVRSKAVLTIASRTKDRAIALAKSLDASAMPWEKRGGGHIDVLINCTPIGMHPNVEETPLSVNWLQEHMVVFDTVYNPENTLLLKEARARGCATVSGLEMFVRQAAAQFERFTGTAAPVEVMRETLRRGISPVRLN